MYFEVFNHIVFDNEMKITLCLSDEYVCAAMTVEEILEIVPEIKSIMDSRILSEISNDIYEFICDLPISEEILEKWEDSGLNKTERFFVALAYSSVKLEDMRYHICQICESEYFSTDTISKVCDQCSERYNGI